MNCIDGDSAPEEGISQGQEVLGYYVQAVPSNGRVRLHLNFYKQIADFTFHVKRGVVPFIIKFELVVVFNELW